MYRQRPLVSGAVYHLALAGTPPEEENWNHFGGLFPTPLYHLGRLFQPRLYHLHAGGPSPE